MKIAPLHRKALIPTALVLAAFVVIGTYFVALRLIYGLGAISHLNSGYSWGIWVVVDIYIATAFGSGGFAMAMLVYVFNRGEYHPMVRPALVGGMFGYTIAGLAAFLDLGRYWQAYNVLLPWYGQPHSVMFEVALCMLAYTGVLWIEFAPVVLERWRVPALKRFLDRWMFVFIALGILLPLMHQSSFGSVFLVMGPRLSPLWFTVWLPFLFVVSAILVGFAVVMVDTIVMTNMFNLPSEQPLIVKLSRIAGWTAVVWLAVRWGDLIYRDVVSLAFAQDLKSWMFWIENALFLGAAVVFLTPAGRASQRASFLAASALLAVGALYRVDVIWIGVTPVGNWIYFPSLPELMVTAGLVSLEVLLYLVFVNMFAVLPPPAAITAGAADRRLP